jgi:hypothetical protein
MIADELRSIAAYILRRSDALAPRDCLELARHLTEVAARADALESTPVPARHRRTFVGLSLAPVASPSNDDGPSAA